MITTTRTRWAAIGAAIAVTLGAGGIGITHATTSSGAMPIFRVLDEPCRLADTRPAPDTVGPRTAGIGEGETYDLDGWGIVGNCDLPADTASLSLNVTAVGATQQTNLRFFPQGSPVPTAANLNPSPGASPTPNAVNVGLNETTGQFSVFNAFGTVAVIIDVIGYYDDHVHTGDDIVDGSLRAVDLRDEAGVSFATDLPSQAIPAAPGAMITTRLRVPVDGWVKIEVTGDWLNSAAGTDQASCQLVEGTDGIDIAEPSFLLDDRDTDAGWTSFSAHRIVEVEAPTLPFIVLGSGTDFSLVCEEVAGSPSLSNLHLSATYFSTSYKVTPPVVVS